MNKIYTKVFGTSLLDNKSFRSSAFICIRTIYILLAIVNILEITALTVRSIHFPCVFLALSFLSNILCFCVGKIPFRWKRPVSLKIPVVELIRKSINSQVIVFSNFYLQAFVVLSMILSLHRKQKNFFDFGVFEVSVVKLILLHIGLSMVLIKIVQNLEQNSTTTQKEHQEKSDQ